MKIPMCRSWEMNFRKFLITFCDVKCNFKTLLRPKKLSTRVPTKFQFMSTPDNAAHAVLIYSRDNDKFKVKDSRGVKYEIPINRPDSVQVDQKFTFDQL